MRFKEARTQAGLSQQQVADQLGIHQTAISNWEKGKNLPAAAMLAKVAHLYGCSIDELFRSDGDGQETADP